VKTKGLQMNRPIIQKIGKYTFKLVEDFTAAGVTVPAGFEFDGASVPRILWTLFNPVGELFEASIVHDYMYENAIGTKQEADNKFYEIAKMYKANRAYFAYLAVKFGGKGNYV
jgi:hypothetical protein